MSKLPFRVAILGAFALPSLVVLAPSKILAAPAVPDTSAKAIVLSAAHYVDDYQKQLSYLIAEEGGTQDVFALGGAPAAAAAQHRTTKAEVFLTFLDDERAWFEIRDVTEVDGQPLLGKTDLRGLLAAGPLMGLARTLTTESSRYNIGHTLRTFNEPTIALRVLTEQHRDGFSFTRKSVTTSPEGTLVTVAFSEKSTPTLIRNGYGGNAFSKGDFVIEAATGRVRESHLEVTNGSQKASLETTYGADDRLEMWVPTEMAERYEDKTMRELTVCESHYSNYKRFEVEVRIK